MDLILARIDQLEEQARQQAATNQAQASTIEAHAASIARLSNENENLRRTVEDQDRVIGELARGSASEGFWIWESAKDGREEGRWLWSNEKYRSLPINVPPHPGPPASLDSLPIELVDMIISFLPRSVKLRLSRCSFKLLTALFISSRMTPSSQSSPRIRSLLLPSTITLYSLSSLHPTSYLHTLNYDLPSTLPLPLPIHHLVVHFNNVVLFEDWYPYLGFFNPEALTLKGPSPVPRTTSRASLSTFVVSKGELSFSLGWTRLRAFWGFNEWSVPILKVAGKKRFGLSECLRRGGGGRWSLVFDLVTPLLNGEEEVERVKEGELASRISSIGLLDPLRVRKGPYLRVTLGE